MNRDVVLVIYAVALGWCLNAWWRAEKESIIWDAADELGRRQEAAERFNLKDPQPSPDPEGLSAGANV